jgi:non-ribosomal peptide synthetase component E (peptide arylation enzyme)
LSQKYPKSGRVVGRVLRDKAEKPGDKVSSRTERVTYNEMNSRASRFARAFSAPGFAPGEKDASW